MERSSKEAWIRLEPHARRVIHVLRGDDTYRLDEEKRYFWNDDKKLNSRLFFGTKNILLLLRTMHAFSYHVSISDGFDLEMQRCERQHETLEILHEIVELSESYRIRTVLDFMQGSDLMCGKRNVFSVQEHF